MSELYTSFLESFLKQYVHEKIFDEFPFLIAEAKAMLVRSPESVQEIAFRLGFKDAAHFSRFFKKHAKQSPLSFRQSLQS